LNENNYYGNYPYLKAIDNNNIYQAFYLAISENKIKMVKLLIICQSTSNYFGIE